MMTQSRPRAETLASRGTYRVAIHRERLPGELLSGSERPSPGWFLDMKYQTCFFLGVLLNIIALVSDVAIGQGVGNARTQFPCARVCTRFQNHVISTVIS